MWRRCVYLECKSVARTGAAAIAVAGLICLGVFATSGSAIAQTAATSPYLEPAPDIFEATGRAAWDGKRTLQGIWVAHPQATTARRVRIFNEENGRAVDGALFKRDTADGASAVLISSEAAQLLGISPGSSVNLRIVAVTPLDRPIAQTAPTGTEAEASTASAAGGEPPTETTAEIASPVEAQSTPRSQEETKPEAPQTQAAPVEPEPQPEPEPQEPAQTTAPAASTAEAPAVEPEPETETVAEEDEEEPPVDPANDPIFTWETGPTEPEEPEERVAAAPAPQSATPQSATPQPASTPTETPSAPATQGTLSRPFVQAGTFGVAENATKLIARLEQLGIPAVGRAQRLNGRQLTRVLAGPFDNRTDRDAAQSKIRGLGLRDAVPVRR